MLSELFNFFNGWLWGGSVPTALAEIALPITVLLSVVVGFLAVYLMFKLIFGVLYHFIGFFH